MDNQRVALWPFLFSVELVPMGEAGAKGEIREGSRATGEGESSRRKPPFLERKRGGKGMTARKSRNHCRRRPCVFEHASELGFGGLEG